MRLPFCLIAMLIYGISVSQTSCSDWKNHVVDSNIRFIFYQMQHFDTSCWLKKNHYKNERYTKNIQYDTSLIKKINELLKDTSNGLSLRSKIHKYKIPFKRNFSWGSEEIYVISSQKSALNISIRQSKGQKAWMELTLKHTITCTPVAKYNTEVFPDAQYYLCYLIPYLSFYIDVFDNERYILSSEIFVPTQ
jgi:hypothetical protein